MKDKLGSSKCLKSLSVVLAIFIVMSSLAVLTTENVSAGITTANFSYSPIYPDVGEEIQFTDESTGDISSVSWDMGDGTTYTTDNPTHSYSSSGMYQVNLTATDSGGTSYYHQENVYIKTSDMTAISSINDWENETETYGGTGTSVEGLGLNRKMNFTDAVETDAEYLNAGTWGNFGSNMHENFTVETRVKVRQDTWDLLFGCFNGQDGDLVTELEFILNWNYNESGSNGYEETGTHTYHIRDYDGNHITGIVNSSKLVDGDFHTLKYQYRDAPNNEVNISVDGKWLDTHNIDAMSPDNFNDFNNDMIINGRNLRGDIGTHPNATFDYFKVDHSTLGEVVNYQFNDYSGSTVYDLTDNNYNGNTVNSPTYQGVEQGTWNSKLWNLRANKSLSPLVISASVGGDEDIDGRVTSYDQDGNEIEQSNWFNIKDGNHYYNESFSITSGYQYKLEYNLSVTDADISHSPSIDGYTLESTDDDDDDNGIWVPDDSEEVKDWIWNNFLLVVKTALIVGIAVMIDRELNG